MYFKLVLLSFTAVYSIHIWKCSIMKKNITIARKSSVDVTNNYTNFETLEKQAWLF